MEVPVLGTTPSPIEKLKEIQQNLFSEEEYELKYRCRKCGHEENSVVDLHLHVESHSHFPEDIILHFKDLIPGKKGMADYQKDWTVVVHKDSGETMDLQEAQEREDIELRW
jgi:hypothetical protein